MSKCLNPDCLNENPSGTNFCQKCGNKLLLADRYRPKKLLDKGDLGGLFLAVDEHKPSRPVCVIKQFYPQAQGTSNIQKATELFEQEAVRLELVLVDFGAVKYSQGRFGFSVQKKIWLECGGKADYETECKLGDRVGWRKGGSWLNYDDLTFKLNQRRNR